MQLDKDKKLIAEKRIHRSAEFQRDLEGTETLDEIDKFCGYKDDTFNHDPYIQSYTAGKRAVSIFIHNCIEQNVEELRERLKGTQDG